SDRDGAGRPAGALPLAACVARGGRRRRPGAHRRRLVERGGRPRARLFPRRGQSRTSFLAVSRRPLSFHRAAAMVPARYVCVSFFCVPVSVFGVPRMSAYVEFAVTSNFSFLRGASHPEELIVQADHLGLGGLGLADRNSVAGVVRAHLVKRENDFGLRYHPGSRLVFADGTPDILAYPRDRAAWGRLTRLLTIGNRRPEKGDCTLHLDDLLAHADGLELVVMGSVDGRDKPGHDDHFALPALLGRLVEAAPQRVRLAASMLYRGSDRARLTALAEIAR